MNRSETFKEFATAFAKFQAEVTNPKLTAENPHFRSKYAPLSEVFNTVRPLLGKHGLSVYQDVSIENDRVVIITTLYHESGEFLESSPLPIPASRGGKGIDAQSIGAAISYGKRYSLQAAIGVAADEDSDGEELANRNEQQVINIPSQYEQPTKAVLKVKYQLLKGDANGFDEYYKKLLDKGHDNAYILAAIEKASEQKSEQQNEQQEITN